MTSPTFSIADEETGVFSGRVVSGSLEFVSANTPLGCIAVPGRHDHRRRRLDIATGEIVPYQPPAPAATEWQAWAWDAQAEAWLPVPTDAARARDIKAERARRLLACDWTQLPDVPANTAQAWAAYRQALRDITDQPTFPASVTWPVEP